MNRLLLPKGFKDPVWLEAQLKLRPEAEWRRLGKRRALALFHNMAERVPAYKDFLKKHKVDHRKIVSAKDFAQLPAVDKDNYLRAYPREALCWDGEFSRDSWTISTTSGSTGKPFYFPRQNSQDWQYAVMAELYLRSNFDIQNRSTLYIVAFPMGAWIGGLFTYEALKIIAERGRYNLSIITPGIHKQEILEAVKQLGKDFDQILIGSYAPFLKDIIDDGVEEGINWRDYNLGFIFSAEGFNEVFRDYVIKKTGLRNPYKDTLNHYGTVDMGTMAHETPLSVMLRRAAINDLETYKAIFDREDRLPTFAQYNPALFYFEQDRGNLYCSSYSGLPLVRYDLKDSGGIITLSQASKRLKRLGYDLDGDIAKAGIKDTVWNLPFVYVYERNDFSVSFYAFQIYPETIRRALQAEELQRFLSGKFTMTVRYDNEGQQRLEIHVELRPGQPENDLLRSRTRRFVVDALLDESSEYRETHIMYGERVHPDIIFWPYEDATHFRPGTKQKWVKK
jgi:phenylacetate-CoA ligase